MNIYSTDCAELHTRVQTRVRQARVQHTRISLYAQIRLLYARLDALGERMKYVYMRARVRAPMYARL